MVLAFLVYHGEGSSRLIDFDAEYSHLPEEIKRDLFGVKIREVNITELDPNAISNNLLYISYLLVSINRAEDKRHHIEFILKQMSNSKDTKLQKFIKKSIETIFYYFLYMTDLSYQELKDIIDKYYSREVDQLATTAEQLSQKGRKNELEEMAIKQLENKFKTTLSDEMKDKIEQSSIEKLRMIRDQIFEIESLNEVERILQ